jgi:mannose-6-phosphate isomerase-like protein (cupin superfamily)
MDSPLTAKAYSLTNHEGRALWHFNALLIFKALSVETDGLFWMMEVFAEARFGMPVHIHGNQDEVLYMLEGEIVSVVDNEELIHTSGAFIYIPRGVPHTVRIKSAIARWLSLGISGNLDQWFFETGDPAKALTLPPVTESAIWDYVTSLEAYGTHIVRSSSVSLHPKFFITKGENIMSATASALPILPGKTDEWKRVVAEATGKRRAELDDMHKRLNIRAAHWFLQPTPNGDVAIVYLEGDGAELAFAAWGQSQHPFDMWFKQSIGPTYGIDFNVPPPGPAPMMMYEFHS